MRHPHLNKCLDVVMQAYPAMQGSITRRIKVQAGLG
jgi:hypothetical protein